VELERRRFRMFHYKEFSVRAAVGVDELVKSFRRRTRPRRSLTKSRRHIHAGTRISKLEALAIGIMAWIASNMNRTWPEPTRGKRSMPNVYR
jgi:hypothetical protein